MLFRWLADRPRLEIAAIVLTLIIGGSLGAWVSQLVRIGRVGMWMTFAVNLIVISVWAYQSRYSKMPLPFASLLFDLTYNGSWFLFYVLAGEAISLRAGVGIGLIVIGLAFIA